MTGEFDMATYDLIIRNGTIVDGTGAPRFAGDVAVKDGLIAAVGTVRGNATREIDAGGKIVAPGWVDIHTHYDGQATWDAEMAPSSWHGVTTVVRSTSIPSTLSAPRIALGLAKKSNSISMSVSA